MSKQYEGCFCQRLEILLKIHPAVSVSVWVWDTRPQLKFISPASCGVIPYVRKWGSGFDYQEWLPGTSLQHFRVPVVALFSWQIIWKLPTGEVSNRVLVESPKAVTSRVVFFNSILKCAQSQEVRRQEAGRDWFGSSTAKEPLQAACPKTSLSSGLTASAEPSAELANVFP